MAQSAQDCTDRNTIDEVCEIPSDDSKRFRNWFFTLNNYTQEDIKFMQMGKKYVFQEETGKMGTPHLQGTIIFGSGKTFATMKKIHGKVSWRVCRNLPACINYCCKDNTRTGKVFTNIPSVMDRIKSSTLCTAQREKNSIDSGIEFYKKLKESLLKDLEKEIEEIRKKCEKDRKMYEWKHGYTNRDPCE